MRNRLGKNVVLFPEADLNDEVISRACNHDLSFIVILYFFEFWLIFSNIFTLGKILWSFCLYYYFSSRPGINTLMSLFHGLNSYFFRQKMEKTRPMKGRMDGKVFISRESQHFLFVNCMIEVLFRICISTWRVNTYVSRQGKSIKRRNESTVIIIIYDFGTVKVMLVAYHFNCFWFWNNFLHEEESYILVANQNLIKEKK